MWTVADLSGGQREDLLTSHSRQHPAQSAQRLLQHVILVTWVHLVPPVAHKQGGGRVKSLVTAFRRLDEAADPTVGRKNNNPF